MAASFEHWPHYEARLKTDHWSKLTSKSLRLTQLATGNYSVVCAPQVTGRAHYRRHSFDVAEQMPSRTLARVGSAQLNQQICSELPSVQLTRQLSLPPRFSRTHHWERVPSASNDRAKRGFKYWADDGSSRDSNRKKTTLGSRGSFLGIGIPRL